MQSSYARHLSLSTTWYISLSLRSIYFNTVILHATPALQQLVDGIALNGLLDAIREKPKIYEVIFTKKANSLFTWSYEDFMENFEAEYSEQGSIKHAAEVNCHKAFMDAMEEAFNDGVYFWGI